MRHHNTLMHNLLQFIPWARFDRLVDDHGADLRARRLTTKSQLIALLHGQLAGAESLREIEATLSSHRQRLYHLGARAPARSTLADANAKRPAALFADLFGELLRQAHPRVRRHARDAVHLLDSTHVELHSASRGWAKDKKREGAAAKVHVVLDGNTDLPLNFQVTPVRVNDITMAKSHALEPGTTYVFDMGYYDFSWWRRINDANCRFVTRLKRHTRPRILETRAVIADGPILSDRIVKLDARLKSHRTNPLAGLKLREIEVVIDSGKILRIISNDLDASAEEIADLYKQRWRIELFFKWIKQNLKIRRFLGTSENAVRIQIAVALIAYLLVRMAYSTQTRVTSLLRFIHLIKSNLLHRRSIHDINRQPQFRPPDPRQKELAMS